MKKAIILFCFFCCFGLTTSAQNQCFGLLLAESDAFYDSAKYVEAYQRYVAMTWVFNNPEEMLILNKRIERTRNSIGKLKNELEKEISDAETLQRSYENGCVEFAILNQKNKWLRDNPGRMPGEFKRSSHIKELDLHDFGMTSLPGVLTKFANLNTVKLEGNKFENSDSVYFILSKMIGIDTSKLSLSFSEPIDLKFDRKLKIYYSELRELTQNNNIVPEKYCEKVLALNMYQNGNYIETLQFYDLIIDQNPALVHTLQPFQKIVFETIEIIIKNLEETKDRVKKIRENTDIITFDRAAREEYYTIKSCIDMNQAEYNKIESLSFRDFGLIELPGQVEKCKNLRKLILIGNNNIIWEKVFKLISPKTYILVSDTAISQIPFEFQNRISGIQSKNLNKLANNIANLKSINHLETTEPNLSQNSWDAILKNENLEYLSLSYCGLTELPSDIKRLTKLKVLELNNNQIKILPPEIGELKSLEVLDIGNNSFKDMPDMLFSLPNLKTIKLSNNNIEDLPPGIGNNSNVENLYLDKNQLKLLAKEIGKLEKLRNLDLSLNNISELPQEIENLTNITSLVLRDNKLNVFPNEILKLSKLEKLDLSRNSISSIPPGISNMSALKHLDLWFNKISTLPPEFKNLTKLKYLNLASNQIRYVQDSPIWKLVSLETLILKRNQIQTIPEDFKKMKNLKILDLSENPLDNNTKAKLEKFRKEGLTIHL